MAKNRRKVSLWVVSSDGGRQRFLRGVITHHLVQRGVDFDDAYAIARAVRDHFSKEDEVTTSEVRDRVRQQLETTFGADQAARYLAEPHTTVPRLEVESRGRTQPFSRGLLARSLAGAGLDFDRAYRRVTELEGELRREGLAKLGSDELARRVGDLLERGEGEEVARRYRLVRRVQNLPRPLVLYIGGASGTGKSTLSLELAPLLKIYRVTATDTVRQVMRTLFSPQILPAIHRSSFDAPEALVETLMQTLVDDPETDIEVDPHQRLVASFLEQAVRLGVGVRAVVERSVQEHVNVLVEGVHLVPPVVPFRDLAGACYQVPLLLGIPDVDTHRRRFLDRGLLSGRRAERYVERFEAIRTLHDFILDQAEAEDLPFLDTSEGDAAVHALRLVTSLLQKELPTLLAAGRRRRTPSLLVILDGLADRPCKALDERTPLAAAETPTFDRLAREGRSGLADPVAPGVVPDTGAGSLALFAQPPQALERGPIEALGAGFVGLSVADVALRGNFATLDDEGRIVDRRAGRIREGAEELARALDGMTLPGGLADRVEVRVRAATEHRLAVVLRGDGLSAAIRGSDPGDSAEAESSRPRPPEPIDPKDRRAAHTAWALALFEQEARRVLEKHPVNRGRRAAGLPPANAVLTRGAGRIRRLEPLEREGVPLRVTCIAGDRTLLGLARWIGAETLTWPSATANLDTNLEQKFEAVERALATSDLVVLHLKGADIAAHDQRPKKKAAFLAKVDRALGELLQAHEGPLRVALGSDHATYSTTGRHGADPVPVVLWGEGVEPDEVERWDEESAKEGALGRFPLQLLLGRLLDLE